MHIKRLIFCSIVSLGLFSSSFSFASVNEWCAGGAVLLCPDSNEVAQASNWNNYTFNYKPGITSWKNYPGFSVTKPNSANEVRLQRVEIEGVPKNDPKLGTTMNCWYEIAHRGILVLQGSGANFPPCGNTWQAMASGNTTTYICNHECLSAAVTISH